MSRLPLDWRCFAPVNTREDLNKVGGFRGDVIWVDDEQRTYLMVEGEGWQPTSIPKPDHPVMEKFSFTYWVQGVDPATDGSWDLGPFDD